jgi:predicted aspartyl protease
VTALLFALATVIPFRWTPGQIEVQVSVNGAAPAWFVVDTGAEYSILDRQLADSLGLETFERWNRSFARGVALRIGGVELRDQEVMIMKLDNFRRQGRSIAGLVGYDFFARNAVRIDYAAQTLTIGAKPPPSATVVPLTFAGRLAVVPVTIALAGGAPLRANVIIDTGAQQAMILRRPFARKHGLIEAAADQPTTTSESVDRGRTEFLTLPAGRITLSRWSFDEPRIKIYGHDVGAGGSSETDGLLGNEILRHFVVTVDYAHARMILEPAAKYHSR